MGARHVISRRLRQAFLGLVAMGAGLGFGIGVSTLPAAARAIDCEDIAAHTASQFGLPAGLMPAIARVETGLKQGDRGVRAWPWTLNVAGQGYYFKTREEALAKLRQVLAAGTRNVDVGCMQINYRWHADQFGSIEEMMNPEHNTAYAAKFLTRLKKRHGSWEEATKYYHSSDGDRGSAYLGRVNRVLARLPQEQPSFVASTAANQPQVTANAASSATANQRRRSGVLALSDYALISVQGAGQSKGQVQGYSQAQRRRSVVLPDSPYPQITALPNTRQTTRRQSTRQGSSTNRQDLIAQLREEFAR